MNLLGSSLLTATAVAPVLIAYAIVALIEQDILMCVAFVSIIIVLVILCLVLLKVIRNKQATSSLSITAVDSADRESLGLMVLYLMPLIRFELDWRILAPAIVLFLSLVVTGTSYHFNPLLNCLGWHFYKVDTKENVKYLLITKKRLRNVNSPITVVELAKYTLMEK